MKEAFVFKFIELVSIFVLFAFDRRCGGATIQRTTVSCSKKKELENYININRDILTELQNWAYLKTAMTTYPL